MAEIRSKRKFFSMWREGLLGNRTLLWDTIEEALAHRPKVTNIGFREIGKTGGGAWELAHRSKATEVYNRWKKAGRRFILDGSVPNDKVVMQGEVTRTTLGMESFLAVRSELVSDFLIINFNAAVEGLDPPAPTLGPGLPPMRQTIARGWHRHRGYLETRILLRRYMDPSSQDDLDMLLDMYPDAAIEFTCFSVNVGVFPHRNTIFWEVRNY